MVDHPRTLALLALILLGASAAASDHPALAVAVLSAPPVIDGDVGEDEWAGAAVVDEHFGSLQLAYQRGTSEAGEVSTQGDTIFTKLSWVF